MNKRGRIKSISLLFEDRRISVETNYMGKCKVPIQENISGRYKKVYKQFTPREVVEHDILKNLDPFLTLVTGEKIRVYQGGDSSYMLVSVESILDLHEEEFGRGDTAPPGNLSWDDFGDLF